MMAFAFPIMDPKAMDSGAAPLSVAFGLKRRIIKILIEIEVIAYGHRHERH
ncbi:MAG: hypothetical protein IJA51_06460 [Oscillospiraceae bacterium]|nr:hypothetical protein [Oscillospiraceae bacterium]